MDYIAGTEPTRNPPALDCMYTEKACEAQYYPAVT